MVGIRCILLLLLPLVGGAFSPIQSPPLAKTARSSIQTTQQFSPSFRKRQQLYMEKEVLPSDGNDDAAELDKCWSPQLRRIVGSMAGLGALETAYLTYTKLTGNPQAFCGPDGGCNSVLNGPYATIPFTEIPLASLGLASYSIVALLALFPLVADQDAQDDTENRIWLTAATTTMGTFSAFLMSLLFGVLHANCPFCLVSACLSIGMAGIVWIGGGLPEEESKRGMQTSAGSFVTSVLTALVLFFSVDDPSVATQFAGSPGGVTDSQTLLASSSIEGLKPPPITTASTERSLAVASELQALDARMFGAYWCSHCYDQKQTLGKEAFSKIQYVECSKDGYNQQRGLCSEANIPGYPTWQIKGKLYPGEQALEELEEIIQQAKK